VVEVFLDFFVRAVSPAGASDGQGDGGNQEGDLEGDGIEGVDVVDGSAEEEEEVEGAVDDEAGEQDLR